MKKFLTLILFTVFMISACATETPLPTLTIVPATDTSIPPTATAVAIASPLGTETTIPTVEALVPTETTAPQNTTSSVSFANHVLPILQTKCLECHGGRQTKEGFDVSTYDSVLAGSFDGAVLFPGNASDSLMVQLIQAGEMPNRGPAVTSEELQLIIDWINQGAMNN